MIVHFLETLYYVSLSSNYLRARCKCEIHHLIGLRFHFKKFKLQTCSWKWFCCTKMLILTKLLAANVVAFLDPKVEVKTNWSDSDVDLTKHTLYILMPLFLDYLRQLYFFSYIWLVGSIIS